MAGSDRDRLERINSSIGTWEQERDAEAIEKLDVLLSPELLFRRADGSIVGKPEFMPFASVCPSRARPYRVSIMCAKRSPGVICTLTQVL